MVSNLERYKEDLSRLIVLGKKMSIDITLREVKEEELDKELWEQKKKINGIFENEYQKWYTESNEVIRQLLPGRLSEFETLYKSEPKPKAFDITTYTIQNWLIGIRATVDKYTGEKSFNDLAAVVNRFNLQLEILRSIENRFESSLFDIKQLVKADIFDSELDSARELLKNGFVRGAGAIAGVILEKHLSDVCANHKISIRKKNPTISDFNDQLKNNDVIDVPTWRFIQRLGDLRNLCTHKKQRDPNRDEVEELIDGVDKVTRTLF